MRERERHCTKKREILCVLYVLYMSTCAPLVSLSCPILSGSQVASLFLFPFGILFIYFCIFFVSVLSVLPSALLQVLLFHPCPFLCLSPSLSPLFSFLSLLPFLPISFPSSEPSDELEVESIFFSSQSHPKLQKVLGAEGTYSNKSK